MSPLVTLHRYFIAANKMRILFDGALTNLKVWDRAPNAHPLAKLLLMHADDYGVFMFYWYSSMYVVIEGFRELNLSDPTIDPLLQSPNVDSLRLMRNATFHFQQEYLSPKMSRFMQDRSSVAWIRALTEAFSQYFLREIPKLAQNEKVPPV